MLEEREKCDAQISKLQRWLDSQESQLKASLENAKALENEISSLQKRALKNSTSTTAVRSEDEFAPDFNACMNKTDGDSFAMNECFQNAYDYWDRKLNVLSKEVRLQCKNDGNS